MSFSESAPRFFTATGFSFIIALLLSMGVAAYSLHSVREFQDAEIWINDAQHVNQKLEETSATVKDLVGAARGYALTGQSEYLDRYITARDALPPMMAALRKNLDGNAAQLQRQAEDSQRRALRTKYAIFGGNLLSCLMLIWVFLRLRREMRKRHLVHKDNESKIENLNLALRTRAAQLELANKELEGFSYSVSHDLRAPLRVIGGYAMMLEEDHAEALGAEGKRYLDVIRANTRKMDALIVDLLKLAKSTLTPLTLTMIDMRQMVRKAIDAMELENSNAAITVGQLYDASGNAPQILQVWENLLANAAKFSRRRPHPAIRISAEQSPQETVYCIEDNGVGFDVAQAPKLFDVFQRFHSQDEFPGTGIGLALVKRIVTRHGGRVWAQSQPDAGARFYFSLPNALAPARAALLAGDHLEGPSQP